MAAAATFLLRRSACVISASQYLYCRRYLSTAAAKRTRLFVPTVRQFSSSPVVNNIQTPSSDVNYVNDINNQQPVDKDKLVRDVLSQLETMRDEIESLRKANEIESLRKANEIESLRKANEKIVESSEEKQVVDVKEKHPLLKEIEAAMSNDETSSLADMLPDGFEVQCDKPGVAKVILKKAHKKEIINIEVFTPCYDDDFQDRSFKMELIVKVSFSRFLSSTAAEFHCTARVGELVIDKIKNPSDGPNCEGVIFELLPESLQIEFYNYLEIRGIDDDTPDMLHSYMMDKMKRENMRGLGKFKKLVDEA